MKKLLFNGIALIAFSIVTLTSCLSGGDNITTDGVYGLATLQGTSVQVKYSDYQIPIRISNTSSELYNVVSGNLYGAPLYAYITINFDDEANADIDNKGYYTATISNYVEIEEEYMENSLTDTTTVLDNEIFLTDVYPMNYVDSYLFINVPYSSYKAGQKNNLYLSFDSEKDIQVIEDKKVYNLFLRVAKEQEGSGSTVSNYLMPYAFNIYSLLSHARTHDNLEQLKIGDQAVEGYKTIRLKVNYAKEIAQDSTSVKTWGTTSVYEYIVKQ